MERARLVSPFVMWAIIAAGFVVSFGLLPARYLWHRSYAQGLVAGALLVYWVVMGGLAIGRHRRAGTSAANVTTLVTDGPYALVRHPMYSGDLAAALAVMLIAPDIRIIAGATWAIAVLVVWMELEERVLCARFGEQYRAYQRHVPRFMPYRRRK